ncbi:MAG: hypothetical protein AAGF28_00715 [Pseudomonadota bacterium]
MSKKTAIVLEKLIMEKSCNFVRELRLVDLQDYVAFLRFGHHHQIADIVDSASEMEFTPGFLVYRENGFVNLTWDGQPSVALDLAIHVPGCVYEYRLSLRHTSASVELTGVQTNHDDGSYDTNISGLARAFELNSLRAVSHTRPEEL